MDRPPLSPATEPIPATAALTPEPGTTEPAGPKHSTLSSYLICTTPRSGSYLLCEALANTGVAGNPDEYFVERALGGERWSTSDYARFLGDAIGRGTTPNGVFGAKVMWAWFDDFTQTLHYLAAREGTSVPQLLSVLFPNLHYIRMIRRDRVRQAISHLRAMHTGIWRWTADEPPVADAEPPFDFGAIDRLVEGIAETEACWQRFFQEHGITPLTVEYEDLAQAYEETALRVLRFLSIPVPERLMVGERRMKKQAGAHSEEWVRRYHALKGKITPWPGPPP